MKKLFYTLLVATVGLLTASCMQEHVEAIYDPAAATAQTLASISDVVLDAEGDAITTTFNPADFKMTVASTYTLFASAASDMSDKVKASAILSVDESGIGHISMKQSTVNSMVFALGGEADVPFTVYFQLEGAMANDKNGAIGATMLYSNIVSATFTPYSMDIKDVDLYEHVWVIGASANVGGWSFDNVFQYLYNYEKTGTTFTGLIDFGEAGPSGGFKLVGVNNWDDESKNWGSEAQAEEPEQATIQLIAAGSSKDIKCYSKRFYFFSYDTGTLVLTAKYAIDNVGIVGAFNGWNEKDANMKMEYNPYYHRFYIDYTFDDATELKFTCNDAWEINWGGKDGTIAGGGDNIAVEPGSYRIYLDINHGTYEFSTSMYGKNEPTGGDEPEPEPTFKGWGIVGDFSEWGNDVALTENKGVWSGYFTNIEKEGGELAGFKFRKDADWAENYGAPGDVEPYPVVSGETIKAVAGGKNLGTKGGLFKAVLDLTNESEPTITITEANVFSLIGQVDGANWDSDIEMTEKDGVWTSPVVTIDGEFKIRHNFSWADDNTYGLASAEDETKVGEEFELSQPGANMKLAKGDYKVQFTPETKKVLITAVAFPEQLYMIGEEFGNWSWDSDGVVEMTPVIHKPDWGAEAEAQFYTIRYFTAGKGFKFNSKKAWGGDFWGLTTNDGYTESSGNCVVAQDGYYLVHIDFKNQKVHVEPAKVYGIGDAFGGWDEAVEANLFATDGKTLKATAPKAGKLRMYVESAISTSGWWTREFSIIDGAIVPRILDELAVPEVKAAQVITLNFNEGTGSITGEGEGPTYKEELSVPGNWSVWTADAPKLSGNKKGQFAGPLKMAGEGIEFKFIHDGGWIGGTAGEADLTYVLGSDANMTIAAGTYWWNVDLEAKTAKATPITKIGVIGSFNDWTTDVELTAGQDDAYSATVTMAANTKFKVRFNENWDLALGGTLEATSAYGGDIVVADAGTYTVTVFLNHGKITLTPAN